MSADLIQQYRDGNINMECLEALSVTTDHEAQESAFNSQMESHGWVSGWHIRDRITQDKVQGHDRVAQFVGEEDYLAAGGQISRDFFNNHPLNSDLWFEDRELLERLAADKLEALAAPLRSTWNWVTCLLYTDFYTLSKYSRAKITRKGKPTKEEEAELKKDRKIESRVDSS